jgi:uncharacterized protein with HEPN domain
MKRDDLYLQHILDAITQIKVYTEEHDGADSAW